MRRFRNSPLPNLRVSSWVVALFTFSGKILQKFAPLPCPGEDARKGRWQCHHRKYRGPERDRIGVERIFCLTFETDFFGRNGFEVIEGTPVDPEVYQQLLRSYDEGVAEFLDLERVKPNTLGNTRMLRIL
jgi:hypothetical protein